MFDKLRMSPRWSWIPPRIERWVRSSPRLLRRVGFEAGASVVVAGVLAICFGLSFWRLLLAVIFCWWFGRMLDGLVGYPGKPQLRPSQLWPALLQPTRYAAREPGEHDQNWRARAVIALLHELGIIAEPVQRAGRDSSEAEK